MAFVVKIKGDERVSRMAVNLGPQLNKMIDKTSGHFMKAVQRSAKMRAPKMTGALRESIIVKKGKKFWNLIVESPYGRYQEMGFRGHLVSSNASTKNQLGTIGSAYGLPPGVTLQINSFGGHHFVRDALQKQLTKLPSLMERAVQQGVAKA